MLKGKHIGSFACYGYKKDPSSVRRILSNQMYIGNLVQSTLKIKSYKVQAAQRQDKEDWIIVENTHEPIISKENFETVQDLLLRNTRKAPERTTVHKNIDKLTREVVVALIEMIYIYENNKIKIVFKYQNPFKEAMEYIENNKTLLKEEQAKALLGA